MAVITYSGGPVNTRTQPNSVHTKDKIAFDFNDSRIGLKYLTRGSAASFAAM